MSVSGLTLRHCVQDVHLSYYHIKNINALSYRRMSEDGVQEEQVKAAICIVHRKRSATSQLRGEQTAVHCVTDLRHDASATIGLYIIYSLLLDVRFSLTETKKTSKKINALGYIVTKALPIIYREPQTESLSNG